MKKPVGRPKKKRKFTKKKLDLLSPIVNNMETKIDNALISNIEKGSLFHQSLMESKEEPKETAVSLFELSNNFITSAINLSMQVDRFRNNLKQSTESINQGVAAISEANNAIEGII